eukprot:gb/GECG01009101.1/.p1 GENE.gb/GECG01009101.1/~~gb/GECG01009101.1/.p1  ORF type:complete len:201 (+),score=35.79 gb/GECG01009101.1/:1-603(+)
MARKRRREGDHKPPSQSAQKKKRAHSGRKDDISGPEAPQYKKPDPLGEEKSAAASPPPSTPVKTPRKSEGKLSDRIKSMGFMNRKLEAQAQQHAEEEEAKRKEDQKWQVGGEVKRPKSKKPKSRFTITADNTSTAVPSNGFTARRSFAKFNKPLETLKRERERSLAAEARSLQSQREQVDEEEFAERYERYVQKRQSAAS